MTTSTRGRHRKLRRNILHTVIATALLAGTFTVVDQTLSTPIANANVAGQLDPTFTPSTTAAISIAAFSDSSFVAGYSTSPFVRRYNAAGGSQTLSSAYPTEAFALEVHRGTNQFFAGGQGTNGNRTQAFSQSGTLLSPGSSNYVRAYTSSALKVVGDSIFVGGTNTVASPNNKTIGKFSLSMSAAAINSTFNQLVQVNAVTVNSIGEIYTGTASGIRSFNPDSTSTSFTTSQNPGSVTALEVDNDDNIYAGTATAPYIYKFANSGALDSTFASNVGSIFDGKINSIKIHNNMIYVGGEFTGGLKRLNLDGTPDSQFNSSVATQLTNTVKDIEIDPQGRVLVAYGAGVKRFFTETLEPLTPPAPVATRSGENSISIATTYSGTVIPSSYTVTSSPENKTCTVTGSQGSCTISNLTIGETYSFKAIAISGEKSSPESPASNQVLLSEFKPELQTAIRSSLTTISLTFDRQLANTPPSASWFEVLNGTNPIQVTAIEIIGSKAILTVPAGIDATLPLTMSYAPASIDDSANSNPAIQNISGGDAEAFGPINIQTEAAPQLVSSIKTNATTITLNLDRELANTPPSASWFEVLNGTTSVPISSIAINGSNVLLTLASSIDATQNLTVKYAPATVDDSTPTNLAIQNSFGLDSTGFGPVVIEGASAQLCVDGGTSTKIGNGIYAIMDAPEIVPTSANLVKNGDFSADDANTNYLEKHWAPQSVNKFPIANWTRTGGGAGSYGRASQNNGTSASKWYSIDPSSNATKTILYFGNYYVNSTTWDRVWDMPLSGWVTRPISFVQPNPTSGEVNTAENNKYYGTTPLGVEQQLTTIPGRSYRLQFFAGRELGSYKQPGIAALTIGNQTMHFRIDVPGSESNGEGTRYTVDFKATSASTLIKFASYGHLPERDALTKSTELALDTVRAIECGSPLVANPDTTTGQVGQTQTINLLTNIAGADVANTGTTLLPDSVKICADNESAPCARTSLTVPGVGAYSVNSSGVMTFTPEPTYLGTPPAVRYSVEDTAGAIGTSTYTPTVLDTEGPALAQKCVDATGQILTLTFNETIATAPTAADFTVTAEGQPITITGATVEGKKVRLTLGTRVYPDQTPTISYSLPGDPALVMKDVSGNPSLAFTSTIDCFASPMKYCTTGGTPTQLVDGVYAMTGVGYIDPTLPNLVTNGRFNTGLESTSFRYIGPTTSKTPKGTIPGWTTTGGGSLTYAWHGRANTSNIQTDPVDSSSPARVYFGNTTSTNIKWDGTFTHPTVGWSTATLQMGPHSNSSYGTEPVAISQDLATVAGSVYRLQFFSGREFGSYTQHGIAGLVIEGYQQFYFKIDAFNSGTRYTVDFVAKDSTTNIMFQNWGHAIIPGGETTELAIDTISVGDCNAPMAQPDISSGPLGEIQTVNLLSTRSGFDSPSEGESLVPSSIKLCASTEVAPNCTKTSIVVNGVGSYSVDSLGVMTFTPLPDYIGTPPPISYTVEDTSGAKGTSTYTPTVTPPPMTARPDTTIGPLGVAQSIDLTTNDIASEGATITTSSIKLCNVTANPAEVSPNCTVPAGTPVVVAGVGSYVVNSSGVMTFTPLADYVGTPPALPYIIQDSSGSQGASTYTPTVYGPPVANPDTITTNWDVNQTYIPSTNDTAGTGTTLIANSVKICLTGTPADNCNSTSLIVADEGTYTLNADGSVTFNPLPTFAGTATPIQYVITDSQGQKATSTISPIINPPAAPSATPDTITSNWDVSQTYTPLSNDTANSSFPLLANSVKLCGPSETPNGCTLTSLTIAGEGTYSVNTTTGEVEFNPLPTFTGTATPVTYQAKDSLNRFVSSTISPIVGAPPAPSASPDAQSTGYDITQTYSPASNDTANTNFPLNPTTVKLCQPATTNPPVSAEVPPNCTLTSLTTADGVYTVNTTTGEVEFNPASTFSGTVAAPIKYQVKDSINRTIDSTITPTIGAPPGPTAVPDTSTGNYDTNQTIDPLANDPDNPAISLLPATLKLCGIEPVETPNNCTQTSLFVPGQGSYVVDPSTGLVTFDPLPTFSGTATPIKYQASNASGQVVNSTITATVGAPPVAAAKPDSSSSAMRVVQTVNPLGNDIAGVSAIPLDPTSVKLCGISPVETPNDCTKTTLEVPGKGTFTVNPTTGIVSFTPVDTFNGTVPPVTYTVADTLGREVSSQINIVVLPPPAMAAITDLSSGNYNTAQTINPLTNDTPGDLTAPELSAYTTKGSVEKDPTSVRFCGADNPATVNVDESVSPNCVATSVTTPAGTYVVDTTTGVVTFTPVATFTGTDPNAPTYQTCNNVTGTWAPGTPPDTCASALIIPTVGEPPLPVANPDTSSGNYDTIQTINPLSNDTANTNFPLDPTSVKLCGGGETSPNCTKTTLTVLNEGTYTVNPITGVVTFDPLPTFTGIATPISYQVSDSLGREVSSTIAVTVGEPPLPTANNDTNTGPFDTDQVISPLTNDSPIAAFPFDQTSVKLCGPDDTGTAGVNESVSPNCVALRVETADGVYTVNPNGTVTFNPDSDFTGTVTQPVTYQVTETKTNGRVASATITPTVGPPPAPVAEVDAQTRPYDTNQTYTPTSNDSSNQFFTVTANSVKLCGADDPATDGTNESVPPNCVATTLTVAGEGTYTIGSGGVVTFDPLPSFTGVATPVKYQATDSLDRVINSTITPTVGPPPVAVAVPDTQTQPYDTNQTYTPTSNDTANSNFPITATSVKLCGLGQSVPACDRTSLTTADGVYTVNPATGVVTFNPDADFTGLATEPVTYQATDSLNRVINSTITPTVGPPPVATAVPDAKTSAHDTNQTYTPTSNDTSNEYFPITANSVKLCGADNPATAGTNESVPPNCVATSLTVPNQGTYTVDPATGVVTFDPLSTFTGTATAITYQATDSINRVISSTITPTIREPQAVSVLPDTSTDAWDVTQTKTVLTNDAVGSTAFPFLANTVKICGASESYPTCTQSSVTIPNQGTYTVNNDGTISFDPLPTFVGTATPIKYQAGDGKTTDWSTYTPTVTPPPPPTAQPDVTSGAMGQTQSINLLTNTPGADSAGISGVSLVDASVKLCGVGETTPDCSQISVTVVGVGTYSVSNGVMTFVPEPNYTGTPTPLPYTVLDSTGQKASSTYTPTIIPPPTVVPDTTSAGWDVTQTMNVITSSTAAGAFNASLNTGDSAAPGTTLAAGSVRLCSLSDAAPNCTIDSSGSVVIAGEGTYTVDPATGIVTFDPLPTFTGTATPVTYSVTDALGQKSSTTYTPTVTVPPVPTATPDTVELIPGQSKVFSSIFDGQTGDTDPALATKGTGAPDLTNSSVCLLTPGTSTCDADGVITIAGEGTYTLNPTTGIVTYAADEEATPGAKTPVSYQITDGLGRSVTSTLTPTITPPPVANPDFSTGVQGAIQTLSPVGNDRPGGGASTELYPDTRVQVPSGIFLCAANQPPPDCAASTVTVTDPVTNVVLGVLTVADSGLVTFTPEPDFIGTTPPIGYQIPDNLGQKAYSTITITVVPPPAPAATIDTGSAEYNKAVTLKPWMNDSAGAVPAGSSAPAPNLVATSIKLCDDNSTFVAFSGTPADCTATKVKTVEGTYEVNATTGEVVFTPNPNMVDPITGLPTGMGFIGTVKYPPTYQIWNNWTGLGGAKSATALLVPTIAPPGAPAATVDITKTKPGTSVVLNPVSNDKPGTAALDPTTIRLCGTGEISPSCTQMSVTTLDGLYVVDPATGQVTFTPRDGFTGQATIPYIIKDGLGMMALSELIITVEDTAIVPVAKKTKVGLAKTGGARPDLLLLLGLAAIAGAASLRALSRKK